jgi:hypothetical protein
LPFQALPGQHHVGVGTQVLEGARIEVRG